MSITFFNRATDIKTSPPQVDINGLYILITDTYEKWVANERVNNLDARMQYLHQQLNYETIGQHIGRVLNEWYLYNNCPATYISLLILPIYLIFGKLMVF